jgi:hypothetical protein
MLSNRPVILRGLWLALLAIMSAGSAGCGGGEYEMAAVSGMVTCQGQPVAGGVITFYPIDAPEKTGRKPGFAGGPSQATIQDDGSFTLMPIDAQQGSGALVGPHMVQFALPPTTRPRLTADDRAAMSAEEAKKWDEEFSSRPVYPPCPCSAAIQPAEVEVKSGDNKFEFTLPPK